MVTTNPKGRQSQTPWWLLVAAAVLLLLRVVFPESGLSAEGEKAPEIAQKVQWLKPQQVPENPSKPLLYDFTAAWCLPCRKQAKEVFANEKAAAFINEHFIPVKVAEEERGDKAVSELFSRYHVNAFPTLIVADGRGEVLARQQGYAGKKRTINFLEKALEKAESTKPSAGKP